MSGQFCTLLFLVNHSNFEFVTPVMLIFVNCRGLYVDQYVWLYCSGHNMSDQYVWLYCQMCQIARCAWLYGQTYGHWPQILAQPWKVENLVLGSCARSLVDKPGSQAQRSPFVCCVSLRNIFPMKHKGMSLILLWVFASSVFGQHVEGELFDFGKPAAGECEEGWQCKPREEWFVFSGDD